MGGGLRHPPFLVSSPAPQPAGVAYFGQNGADAARGWLLVVDGKYSYGPVSLYYMLPFGVTHPNVSFGTNVVQGSNWSCYDPLRRPRYKTARQGRVGLTVKGYGAQFRPRPRHPALPRRDAFPPETRTTPKNRTKPALQRQRSEIFRFGGTADLDFNLPFDVPPPGRRRALLRRPPRLERLLFRPAGHQRPANPLPRRPQRHGRLLARPAVPAPLQPRHRPLRHRQLRRRAVGAPSRS